MWDIKTDFKKALIVVVFGPLVWWLTHSYPTAFFFVAAAIAVEILYRELRRIRQTLDVIAEKLSRSSVIGW